MIVPYDTTEERDAKNLEISETCRATIWAGKNTFWYADPNTGEDWLPLIPEYTGYFTAEEIERAENG